MPLCGIHPYVFELNQASMNATKQHIIMTEAIYNSLKAQGLVLSENTSVTLPHVRIPKPTFIDRVATILGASNKFRDQGEATVCVPILSSTLLLGQVNCLLCYKCDLHESALRPVISEPIVLHLSLPILNIHVCEDDGLLQHTSIFFLVQNHKSLQLFKLDRKQNTLLQHHEINCSQPIAVHFISEREILVLAANLQLEHWQIYNSKLLHRKNVKGVLEVPQDYQLTSCRIVGNIEQDGESTILIFYVMRQQKNDTSELVKIREVKRNVEGRLTVGLEDYTIIKNSELRTIPDNPVILKVRDYFCLQTKSCIMVIKKKYEKYLFMDAVTHNIHGSILKLHPFGLISSRNATTLDFSLLELGDPKCTVVMLDRVELLPKMSENLRLLWPYRHKREQGLMLLCEEIVAEKAHFRRTMQFNYVVKMPPMNKMVRIVGMSGKEKITAIQELSLNLGVMKEQFYLTLWADSKKEINDIYQFLLPCGVVPSIKRQLSTILRKKGIVVAEFVKILQRLRALLRAELRKSLNETMLREYIKNDFLLRKIKLKAKDKLMTFIDFSKLYHCSLTQLFEEIAKNQLFPEEKQLDPMHVMIAEPEKEDLDLRHIFQEFRLIILENYKQFLTDFFAHFTSKQLIKVLEHYAFLLPMHPFNLKFILYQPEYMTEAELLQLIRMSPKANDIHPKLNQSMPAPRHAAQNQTAAGNISLPEVGLTNQTHVHPVAHKAFVKPQQSLLFTSITSIDFNREQSQEQIERELHYFYPTSKIVDTVKSLVNSPNGGADKLRKHGLISSTMLQYQAGLKHIEGINLFLKCCELINELAICKECGKYVGEEEYPSTPLIRIFEARNELTGDALKTVSQYAAMHGFMLKHNFCQGRIRPFTAQELMEMQHQDLIALFFLEDRQHKKLLFGEFRSLYVRLQGDCKEFDNIIRTFVQSENCSPIELDICLGEVMNMGPSFQTQNQELVEILIDGFSMKLQIREENNTLYFMERLQGLQMCKQLALKAHKIMQIREALNIFIVFNCGEKTYFEVLDLQRDNQIFKLLMNIYFEQEMRSQVVVIEEEQVSLDYGRNMLFVLLYLQETVYYDSKERDILMIYFEIMIEWKQFPVLHSILYLENCLEKLNIEKSDFVEEVVLRSLHKVYSDDDIVYDEETKTHMREILDLFEGDNPIRRQEEAKLELADIFESFNVVQVHPADIFEVCLTWKTLNKPAARESAILQVLDLYLPKFTFCLFDRYFHLLQTAVDPEEQQGKSGQYLSFLLLFAEKLLAAERYQEILQILAFVKSLQSSQPYPIDYSLLSETVLKVVCERYPKEESLSKGREVIECYTQYSRDDVVLHALFEAGLDIDKVTKIDRDNIIVVDSQYCFKKHEAELSVEMLWILVCEEVKKYNAIVQGKYGKNEDKKHQRKQSRRQTKLKSKVIDILIEKQKGMGKDTDRKLTRSPSRGTELGIDSPRLISKEQGQESRAESRQLEKKSRSAVEYTYYCYYFLLMSFRSVDFGLSTLTGISYPLGILTALLLRFQEIVDKDPSLWKINTAAILRKFRQGLYMLGVSRISGDGNLQPQHDDSQFDVIKAILREKKASNRDLLDCIAKVEQHILLGKTMKNDHYKQQRFEKAKQSEQKSQVKQFIPEQEHMQVQNVTMNLQVLRKHKYELSNMSINAITEKELLEAIYQKVQFEQKSVFKAGDNQQIATEMRILSELDNSKYEEQAEEIHQALLNCDYELLPRINPKILHEVAEKVYEESNKSLGELVSMMEHTHIGSPDRIRLGYLAAEGSHLPDHDLKRIFNFRFLSGEGSRKMPWEDAIRKEDNLESYLMIRSNLLELAKEKSLEWLQKLAAQVGRIFQNSGYISMVYMDVLLDFGSYCDFTTESIVRIHSLVQLLARDKEMLLNQVQTILAVFEGSRELLIILKQQLQRALSGYNDEAVIALRET